jgi:MFS family permease
MGLYVLEITDSGLSFALTLIISIIPMLIINPFAGVLADKFDKKKIVVSMDILNGVFLIFLYIISGIYGLHLIMVYVSIFIATIFTTIFAITMEAAIPNIVSGNMLININSASKIIDSISSMLGPMVGGIVFAFIDIRYFILFSAISYIFSGVSEIFIDFKYNYIEYNTKNNNINFFIDMKEGLKYIRERRSLIGLFSVFISLNFFIGFAVSIPLPYIINNVLVLGSKNLGIIQSFAPVGMMIGALMIKSIIEKKSYKKILTYASSVLSVCIVLLGIPILFRNITVVNTIYTAYYVGIMTVFGATISCIDIPIMYMMQKIIPDEYRGRVFSIGMSMAKIILPVALIISGILINRIPAYFITTIGGILLFFINILILSKGEAILLNTEE